MVSESDCIVCPEGTFCSVGSAEAQPCAPGTYNDQPQQAMCTSCAAGTFQQLENQTACEECRDGYCPEGSKGPTSCEVGARLNDATVDHPGAVSEAECVCKPQFYNNATNGSRLQCKPCPSGSECPLPGVTLRGLPITRGYYRRSHLDIDVRRCPDAAVGCGASPVCLNSTSGCRGTVPLTDAVNPGGRLLNEDAFDASGCAPTLKGIF